MKAIATPQNSIIPTITSAVERLEARFGPLVRWEKDVFLRHLHELRKFADSLWQGVTLLSSLLEEPKPGFKVYARKRKEEWHEAVEAAYADAAVCGISRERFVLPTRGQPPYRGATFEPGASVSISRMLSMQSVYGDDPCVFLLRMLAMRIIFAAHNSMRTMGTTKFLIRVDRSRLPVEWHESTDLQWAAELYTGEWGAEHNSFRYLIVREVELMSDLFELMLRQLADPLPDNIES